MAVILKGKNPSKPYTVRYRWDGRQRERSFRAQREAKEFLAKFEHDSRASLFIEPDSKTTVSAYFARWIGTHQVGQSTQRIYRSTFRNHIEPAFGSKGLAKVTREDVRTLLLVTMPATVGYQSSDSARKVLNGMFGQALEDGKITKNPAARIKVRADKGNRADFYHASMSEVAKLADEIGEPVGLAVWLMRGCGLRIGEAFGVRYEDFSDGMLRVTRQRLANGSLAPLKGRRDGDYRDVPVPSYMASRLDPDGSGDVFPPYRTDSFRQPFQGHGSKLACLTATTRTTLGTLMRRPCWAMACRSWKCRDTSGTSPSR